MNELIEAIAKQAGFAVIEDGVYGNRWYSSKCGMDVSEMEKFAELIVRECLFIIDDEREPDTVSRFKLWMQISDHFGIK